MTLHNVLPYGLLLGCLLVGCTPSDQNQTSPGGQSSEVVASGRFVDKGGQTTSGTYRIERENGDLRLILSEDFRTDEGPDLHIVLSPTAVEEAGNENAMVEGAEVVGPLEALSGSQTYDLPDDLDLTRYASVFIHCIEFTHLYGAAPLS